MVIFYRAVQSLLDNTRITMTLEILARLHVENRIVDLSVNQRHNQVRIFLFLNTEPTSAKQIIQLGQVCTNNLMFMFLC